MFVRFRRSFEKLGPGFVTGASDDDPSGVVTYAQAGAGFGYATLWTILFTIPLMIAVQEMSARIALVTGRGLVGNLRKRYGAGWVLTVVLLLFFANTINIGADLGMMASAAQTLVPLPISFLIFSMAVVSLLLEIFTSYRTYARYLKWLTLSLLAYVFVAFAVHIDWLAALRSTVIPFLHPTGDYVLILIALLGTTISPYLSFWQANQELEEDGTNGSGHLRRKLSRMRFDVGFGMFFSNLIAWFIILTTAAVLFQTGYVELTTADQAARVLMPLAGKFAASLFALGIIGTGLLTIPILAGTAAYAFSEAWGLSEGLSKKWWQAKGFYTIILISTVLGGLMNAIGIPPIKALIYAAVVNAVIAPPILFILIRLANDERVMGRHKNSGWSNALTSLTCFLMTLLPLAGLWIFWRRH